MAVKLYLGTGTEITDRIAAAPSSTTTTVSSVTSSTVFVVASATSFVVGDPVVISRQKRYISAVVGTTITVSVPFEPGIQAGAVMRHYDADYSLYRNASDRITFVDDLKTGGQSGNPLQQFLIVTDITDAMAIPYPGLRASIFEDQDTGSPLFSGVVVSVRESVEAKHASGNLAKTYGLDIRGHQWEADSVGIEEDPQVNVNAGTFLKYLMQKYTSLTEGFIDTTNSPTVDYLRLGNFRRFSDVGRDLSALWAGSEFYIENDHGGGKVYFRQRSTSYAPFTLNTAYLENRGPNSISIVTDHEKTFNRVRLPYYFLQRREPDFFVQSTVADAAFLRTSVVLNGQPANVEESLLLFDDFADGSLDTDFTEDDLANPSPPTGFSGSDGYLLEGTLNGVDGLHLVDTSSFGTVRLGDIGRTTNPAKLEPFTGAERQTIVAKEFVVNALGDGVVLGIIDQTTISTTSASGSTTTRVFVASTANFSVDDRITVGAEKAYIQAIGANYFDLYSALTGAPAAGVTVSKHRLARSRVKFGVYFRSTGDLKYLLNGVETAFSTPRTYTTATYSLRLSMQCFETTIASGISSTGCTLADAASFTTGDVVEIFTQGSRKTPEQKVITKSGSAITYTATTNTPVVGYRVRTLPKIVLEIKGGAFGSITGRDWTTIYTAANTWQTQAGASPADHGVIAVLGRTLVGTLSLFQMKNPVGITANIGSRYLHIGTQEVDSSELDIDCIARKLGTHYQLDFFPDTKALWSSGSTLQLRYDEKYRHELEEVDTESMRTIARQRGYTLTGNETVDELTRYGGRTMDTVQILPNPLTIVEASAQSRALLDAVKELNVTVEIDTETYTDAIIEAGSIIRCDLPGIPDLEVKKVQLVEVLGAKKADGRALFQQKIIAGSIDRLSDVLLTREIKNGSRLVIDDGVSDDSFTRVQKSGINEKATTVEAFSTYTCSSPTYYLKVGPTDSLLMCLQIPIQ